IGLGGRENGVPRETEYVITVASEVMAVLALARDLQDLRTRLGRMVLATRRDGSAVTAEDLRVAGAMTALLTDAIKPNLLQTLEGGPAFVHCGPFANIAHGNNSIIADRLALATNEIVCTEAGFGADMGAEKFFDIKCRAAGLKPDAAGGVATVRALKVHGGVGIEPTPAARKSLKLYEDLGMGHLPVCMAKTQSSLSHDANLKGRPSAFTVPIREIRLSAGAGFITPLAGEMRTMPGLPSRPGGEGIDIDDEGKFVGPG